MSEQIATVRQQIDQLDQQLLDLLNQRAQKAQEVAAIKTREQSGSSDSEKKQGDPVIFYRPEREAQVLARIMQLNRGPLSDEEVARLFREIMSACLALERPTQIAYLGPAGTFTQQAALKHFGHSSNTRPASTIAQVFREVEASAADYGVVPVENSTEGVVSHTLDRFMHSALQIVGEVELRIHHNLMSAAHTPPANITRVYSHSQTLAQCRRWLDENHPGIERVPVASNAEAAKRVGSEWNSAAIAGTIAADLYGLTILAEKIEDRPDNSTRFLIIGRESTDPSGRDKTSLMLTARNKPGALLELLMPFRERQIDLTRLESRPAPSKNWSYIFFVDIRGHRKDPPVQAALKELEKLGCETKILGAYPVAVL
ncbi:MAG: prephenate dehydratase [Cellvibrionales bacterium]|nr:prephenate dehydratase [Cellvibrionales bacterium]